MIALKCEEEILVHVVFLTDGQQGNQGNSQLQPNEVVQLRKQEALNALTQLGVSTSAIHFLDYPDGCLAHLSSEQRQRLVEQLSQFLRHHQQEEVYTPH